MAKYTSFVVGVILAGIVVSPTAASFAKGGRKVRVMQDTATKGTIVSLHQDIDSKFNLEDVEGTVDALFHWDNGVAGNIIWDYEDGSHCIVNANPSERMATFSSGHKLVEFTYSEDGASFYLKDDTNLDDSGEMIAHLLSYELIQASMQAKSKGLLDHDVAILFDCTRDFFTIWDPADDSRWGLSSIFKGVRDVFGTVVKSVGNGIGSIIDVITPDILGCPISDIAGLAFNIVSTLTEIGLGVSSGTRCASAGIDPILSLFTGSFSSIPSRLVAAVGNLALECTGFSSIAHVVNQIQTSCFFDDLRRLELDEYIESRRRLSLN